MTKEEAYVKYCQACREYDAYNYSYRYYDNQEQFARNKYKQKTDELSEQQNVLTTQRKRRSALDTIRSQLEGDVTECIVRACSTATSAGEAYISSISRSNGGSAAASMGTVFRTKSVQEDGATNEVLSDCSQERQRTQDRIETAEQNIRSLRTTISTLSDTIRKSKNEKEKAYKNRRYWSDKKSEYWRLYKSL